MKRSFFRVLSKINAVLDRFLFVSRRTASEPVSAFMQIKSVTAKIESFHVSNERAFIMFSGFFEMNTITSSGTSFLRTEKSCVLVIGEYSALVEPVLTSMSEQSVVSVDFLSSVFHDELVELDSGSIRFPAGIYSLPS